MYYVVSDTIAWLETMPISKIIIKLCGGLGNQMFQYAMGRALSLRSKQSLKFDTSWFSNMEGYTPRKFQLDVFPVHYNPAAQKEIDSLIYAKENYLHYIFRTVFHKQRSFAKAYIKEPCFTYCKDIKNISFPVYLDGYWQSEKYFSDYRQQILQDFTFPPLPAESCHLASKILATPDAVSLHVRRGDYVSNSKKEGIHNICSQKYYNESLLYIKKHTNKPHIFVFSDEPEWCKSNLETFNFPTTVVDLHNEKTCYHDMHLMTLCKHHIIANSSFSWWGAWLSQKGIICAPKQWFVQKKLREQNPCPENWILFD